MSEPDMNLASGISAFEAKEFAKAFKFLSPRRSTVWPSCIRTASATFETT